MSECRAPRPTQIQTRYLLYVENLALMGPVDGQFSFRYVQSQLPRETLNVSRCRVVGVLIARLG